MFIRFDTIHERDGQTHRRTPHDGIGRACIASHGNYNTTANFHVSSFTNKMFLPAQRYAQRDLLSSVSVTFVYCVDYRQE